MSWLNVFDSLFTGKKLAVGEENSIKFRGSRIQLQMLLELNAPLPSPRQQADWREEWERELVSSCEVDLICGTCVSGDELRRGSHKLKKTISPCKSAGFRAHPFNSTLRKQYFQVLIFMPGTDRQTPGGNGGEKVIYNAMRATLAETNPLEEIPKLSGSWNLRALRPPLHEEQNRQPLPWRENPIATTFFVHLLDQLRTPRV
ncbi:uncharacterized protein LOC114813903 [Ornithorhynchus anatinus]|uniref:uncharacterized protein LOC114813903 n=1 Tax=Ornithorhynchus anatinus TaxID=9258 RepID=UPI0019D4546B|nr:uncharacterized protein LOC114813903 [Ornithorhynchus anatinus]